MHPALTVDDSGRLILEVTLSDDQSLVREVWLAVSPDEGRSWYRPVELGSTDSSDSYVAPSDLTPDAAHLASGLGATATGSPTDLPSAGLGVTTETIWPYFHRDGGEYFGITTSSKGVVTAWDDHFGDGRAAIWSRLARVTAKAASAPTVVTPPSHRHTPAAPSSSPLDLPTTGLPLAPVAGGLVLVTVAAVIRRRVLAHG